MKLTWEPSDIVVGTVVKRLNDGETYIIGYRAERTDDRYCLVSLQDGNICLPQTKESMAAVLTANQYWPTNLLKDSQ